MIKNMLNKMSSGASSSNNNTNREAFPSKPQDINSNPQQDVSSASSKFGSSPKTFAEKFAMSLDDVSFVDGEDAYGDAPFIRDAMVHRPSPKKKRASLDIDAVKAKRDEELTIYGFSKTSSRGAVEVVLEGRSSFDDFFYGAEYRKRKKVNSGDMF